LVPACMLLFGSVVSFSSRVLKNCVEQQFLSSFAAFSSAERFFRIVFRAAERPLWGFSGVQRHYGPDLLRSNRGGHQVSHTHQVVGRARERKHPIHLQCSAMPHLAQ
jgi:hypothetical protein